MDDPRFRRSDPPVKELLDLVLVGLFELWEQGERNNVLLAQILAGEVPSGPGQATHGILTLTKEGTMAAGFTVDTLTGKVTLGFTDDKGDADAAAPAGLDALVWSSDTGTVTQRQLSKDEDGFPILPRRPRSMSFPSANGLGRIVSSAMPISSLASYLTQRMGRPVFDATGLNGKYDYTVTFTQESLPVGGPPPRPDDASGLTIFAALEKQLGLRLESKKSIIDIFVIDHWEKTPVEN